MKRLFCLVVIMVTCIASLARGQRPVSIERRATESSTRSHTRYGRSLLSFERNVGQADPEVKFLSRSAGFAVFLDDCEAVVMLTAFTGRNPADASGLQTQTGNTVHSSSLLRLKWLGAIPSSPTPVGNEVPGKSNYFRGQDPAKWWSDIPHYARIRQRVYPGVDVTYYGNHQQLEYDLELAPGVDPSVIRLGVEGTQKVRVNAEGDLVLETRSGEIRQRKPIVYQLIGRKKFLRGHYVVRRRGEIGFEISNVDRTHALVIDPILAYSTYLGGNDDDEGFSIAVDKKGQTYVTGLTASVDFPVRNAFQATEVGGLDVFVTKLDRDGDRLIYSTYLGGSGDDQARDIAIDRQGNAYITGTTDSFDFPTKNPIQSSLGGGDDAFVAKLNPQGDGLIYSTYLGGSDGEFGTGIAVDDRGQAYVTGITTSANFPTTIEAFQSTFQGGQDAYVSKLSKDGTSLIYSTYLGGVDDDQANGIALDRDGHAYVAGITRSPNFPTQNAFQNSLAFGDDAFVTKFDRDGDRLIYSTYLGGNAEDGADAIAVDKWGHAYVTGQTLSTNFPVKHAFQHKYAGGIGSDAFVTKLDRDGDRLIYSTYLGGNGDDIPGFSRGIAVDERGSAFVAGGTSSSNFPIKDALQAHNKGGETGFVTKLDPDGDSLEFSTYLGGSVDEFIDGIAVDDEGNAYLTGFTISPDFPTRKPFQGSFGGQGDAFVSKIGSAHKREH